MNARCLALLATLAAGPAVAQGYAGLGTQADGFAIPAPETRFSFPEDHGPHPDYRIEWWYLTANLTDADGTDYGIQWTLFRSALAPNEAKGWASPQIWLGNAGLTTPTDHYAAERLARGGTGQAGATAQPFEAWIDEWRMASTAKTGDQLDALTLSANGDGFAYSLSLDAKGPLVPQGVEGYSVKSPEGQASHYYSQPFYEIAGTLSLANRDVSVTGQGWLDREYSSQPLSETQDGWDWISLHLDTGAKLMGFRLRDRAGAPFTSATWIAPDGTPTPYPDGALTMTPTSDTEPPTSWQITLPAQNLTVQIDAINPQAWMPLSFPYWEGPVRISGSHAGRGYLEMTGYPEPE
ncbi:lipocalin-like domain-containing protein [Tropicimonas sp. TH_r6]|uniref:lipocalin-like domain-containing protein n=1 Tax=Tropicimonas sp. TH_r6 TaxID=3082085 RepID=UPI002954E138|nr:lipocalin-like domain-containing protein [Tropicimonas sp. TH_r6]MDV7142782.1 lipocalin-like domain-containing protein [Tropicimonas sp. TH_r6]